MKHFKMGLGLVAGCAIGLPFSSVAWAANDSIVSGRHFRVICDFEDQNVAEEAIETAEAIWQIVENSWGMERDVTQKPLTIYLYQTLEAYEAADAKRTGGRFRENLSFSLHQDKSAHLLVQPVCAKKTLNLVGLPGLTRVLIAHEAAHLATYSMVSNHASHPEWLTEGFATFVATEALLEKGWMQAVEDDPYSSTMMARAIRRVTDNRLPPLQDLISGGSKGLHLQDRYAIYWQFFRFMRQPVRKPELDAILKLAQSVKAGAEFKAKFARRVVDQLGGADAVQRLDGEFRQFVLRSRPKWEERYRSTNCLRDRWIQIAFPTKTAMLMATQRIDSRAFRIEGSLEMIENLARNSESHVFFGQGHRGSVTVIFSQEGEVRINRIITAENRTETIGVAKLDGIRKGSQTSFKVEVSDREIEVFLDGKLRVKAGLKDHDGTVNWGLGTAAGSVTIWHGVKMTEKGDTKARE
ncbi:MAG: hypothetical protein IPK83_15480 [Planctomycetes bacterium]|nr:hypothetical protein [Planctomycetota bacterium]